MHPQKIFIYLDTNVVHTIMIRDFADTQNRFYSENIPRNITNTHVMNDVQEKHTSYEDDEDDDPFADQTVSFDLIFVYYPDPHPNYFVSILKNNCRVINYGAQRQK